MLYADDDVNDLFFVERAFARQRPDIEFRTLETGQAILDYLAATLTHDDNHPMPAMAVLDLSMPLPNGFEVLSWIRKQPALRDLPVIVLSSSDQPTDRQQAAALGATDYIIKDASFSALPDLMARWLPPIARGHTKADPRIPKVLFARSFPPLLPAT